MAKGFELTGNSYVAGILDAQNERLEECSDLLEKESQRLLTMELERAKQSSATIREQMEVALNQATNRELA